jgi:ATP-dependent Zn protease
MFKRLAHDGKVVSAEISERTITVDVDLTGIELVTTTQNGLKRTYRGPGHHTFATSRVSDPQLIPTLQAEGVRYSAARSSHWLDETLSLLLPAIALFGIWFYAVRRFRLSRWENGMDFRMAGLARPHGSLCGRPRSGGHSYDAAGDAGRPRPA